MNNHTEDIIKAAKALALAWYRDPPQAEGGDFMANMHALRTALKMGGEWPDEHDGCAGCPDCKGIVWRGPGD